MHREETIHRVPPSIVNIVRRIGNWIASGEHLSQNRGTLNSNPTSSNSSSDSNSSSHFNEAAPRLFSRYSDFFNEPFKEFREGPDRASAVDPPNNGDPNNSSQNSSNDPDPPTPSNDSNATSTNSNPTNSNDSNQTPTEPNQQSSADSNPTESNPQPATPQPSAPQSPTSGQNLGFMIIVEFFPQDTSAQGEGEQATGQQQASPSQPRAYALHFRGLLPQMETFMSNLLQELTSTQQRVINPTSKEAIEALPKVTINLDTAADTSRCSICIEDFQQGETDVVVLPCGHMYHQDCVLPWLKEHNTCPVCRYELPAESSPRAVHESQ